MREYCKIGKSKGHTYSVTQVNELQKLFVDALATAGENYSVINGKENNNELKFSVRDGFYKEFDNWFASTNEDQRIKDGGKFLIGTTTDALKKIGVKDYNIYIGKSKIQSILNDHKEMSIDIIKNSINLLEDPIIILKSATIDDSIIIFGDVYAKEKPVMISVLLNPKAQSGEIFDYAVITSSYSRRKNNVNNLINKSTIYYINENKERTNKWLSALGLQLPSAITKYGSLNRVYHNSTEKVNNNFKKSARNSEYLELAKDPEKNKAKLQEMVNEAAKEAMPNTKVLDEDGNLLVVYHGTNNEFYTFDKDRLGKGIDQFGAGFYLTNSQSGARHYGNRIIASYLSINNPIVINGRKSANLIDANIILSADEVYEMLKYIPNIYDDEESILGDYYDSYWENGAEEWMIEDLATKYTNLGYLDSELFNNYPNEFHKAINEILGKDGIIVNNNNGTNIYVAFNSNQIKSADPVTYDDNGNVIPLEERFNENKEDIRYSSRNQYSKALTSEAGVSGTNSQTVKPHSRNQTALEQLEKVNKHLERENAKLAEDLKLTKKMVKLQSKQTKGKMLDPKSLANSAKRIMRANNANGNSVEFAKVLNDVYGYIMSGEDVAWEGVAEKLSEASDWLMANQKESKTRTDYAETVLTEIRKTKIKLTSQQKQDVISQYGSLNNFRKTMMGKVFVTENTGNSLDEQWQEWAEAFPRYIRFCDKFF